jgi:hypothetical protein
MSPVLQTCAVALNGPLGQHLTRGGTPLSLEAYFTLEGQAAIWRSLRSTGGSCSSERRLGGGICGASSDFGPLAVGDILPMEQREVRLSTPYTTAASVHLHVLYILYPHVAVDVQEFVLYFLDITLKYFPVIRVGEARMLLPFT